MGNTPAKDMQQETYATYIQQQQDMIYKQQQQINSLYQYNLDNRQHDHEQERQQERQERQQRERHDREHDPRLLPSGKSDSHKIDPYKILNISKQYDEKTLKKCYLKAAMTAHPDRGGSRDAFQKVSIAYAVLTKKLKEGESNHSHNDLRDMSKEYSQQQTNQPKVNVNMTDNFDVNLFNKIYSDNKIGEVYDAGYGSWMESNPGENLKIKGEKMFQDDFNKDLFNDTFDKYKREQSRTNGSQMIQHREPEVRISMSNQDSLMTLGQGKISNFGGSTDNLSYTDYKQAFTDGSTLIDTNSVDIGDRLTSINGVKAERSNTSYTMNKADEKIYALQQVEEQRAENNRLKRLQTYDQKHSETYEKIHSLLLR